MKKFVLKLSNKKIFILVFKFCSSTYILPYNELLRYCDDQIDKKIVKGRKKEAKCKI